MPLSRRKTSLPPPVRRSERIAKAKASTTVEKLDEKYSSNFPRPQQLKLSQNRAGDAPRLPAWKATQADPASTLPTTPSHSARASARPSQHPRNRETQSRTRNKTGTRPVASYPQAQLSTRKTKLTKEALRRLQQVARQPNPVSSTGARPVRAGSVDLDRLFHLPRSPYPSPSLDMDLQQSSNTSKTQPSSALPTDDGTPKPDGEQDEPSRINNPPTLTAHGISLEAQIDPRQVEWKHLLAVAQPAITKDNSAQVTTAAQNWLNKMNDPGLATTYRELIDGLSDSVEDIKNTLCYPLTSLKHFQILMATCLKANEAVLQRSIMMSIFHPCYIPPEITWNCEGQWVEYKQEPFFTTGFRRLTMPKPDLVFSFKMQAFLQPGEIPDIPKHLQLRICPDPDRYGSVRSFPFLFVEAKRSQSSLESAEKANLNNASRALDNMYRWMAEAKIPSKFFNNVRVFSIALDATEFKFRVHFAKYDNTKKRMFYYFDDTLLKVADVGISQLKHDLDPNWICPLVQKVLKDYGTDMLLPDLKDAFKIVCTKSTSMIVDLITDGRLAAVSEDDDTPRADTFDAAQTQTQTVTDGLGAQLPEDVQDEHQVPIGAAEGVQKRKSRKAASRNQGKRSKTTTQQPESTTGSFGMSQMGIGPGRTRSSNRLRANGP